MTKHELAEWLHDNYEQLAKAENWQTQEITRVKFEDLPNENKATMLALADRMLKTFSIISFNTVVAEVTCPFCNGDGYTSEHDDNSRNYATGEHDCSGCPIQVQSEPCMATGKIIYKRQ